MLYIESNSFKLTRVLNLGGNVLPINKRSFQSQGYLGEFTTRLSVQPKKIEVFLIRYL